MASHDARYIRIYGKTKKQLEREFMIERYEQHLDDLVKLEFVRENGEFSKDVKDLRELDEAMFDQAVSLENIRTQIDKNLYAEDGSLQTENLQLYLRVLKQFSEIYEKSNMTMARRYLVNK